MTKFSNLSQFECDVLKVKIILKALEEERKKRIWENNF